MYRKRLSYLTVVGEDFSFLMSFVAGNYYLNSERNNVYKKYEIYSRISAMENSVEGIFCELHYKMSIIKIFILISKL